MLDNRLFGLLENTNNLIVKNSFKIWLNSKPAGFGSSVASNIYLTPGRYNKEEIVRILLFEGYFLLHICIYLHIYLKI